MGYKYRLRFRPALHLLGGSVCIDDAEEPQPGAAELHRHSDRGPDHAEVQIEAEELQASDADQVGNPLHVVAEVEMAEAGDDRQGGRQGGALARLAIYRLICAGGGRPPSRARRGWIAGARAAATAKDGRGHRPIKRPGTAKPVRSPDWRDGGPHLHW